MSRAKFILALSLIGAVGLALWIRHGEFWTIDECLDSGGAWNYSTNECAQ
jgi:hypothetical protein